MNSRNPFSRTCLALAICQAISLPSQAATITVNSAADPGAGSGNGDGLCTLREAVTSANAEAGGDPNNGCAAPDNGADLIVFTASLAGQTVTLGGTQIALNSVISIDGSTADPMTISGNAASRIFYVDSATVSLDSLILTGGSYVGDGGAIMLLSGDLQIEDSVISNNTVTDSGGAIFAKLNSSLTLVNSTLTGNYAMDAGGAIYAESAALLSISQSTLSMNVSSVGGAIYADGTPGVTLSNSELSQNQGEFGGALYLESSGSAVLENSTLSQNSASERGGGLLVRNSTGLSVTDCTVSGNSAGSAGGIYLNPGAAIETIADSVITGNQAQYQGGGILVADASIASIVNSTISGNTAGTSGGGMFIINGSANVGLISQTTISGNTAVAGGGGGIAAQSVSPGFTLITNSTITGNRAATRGGGILINGGADTGEIINVTVANNTAPAGSGIYLAEYGVVANLANAIIAGNGPGANCQLEPLCNNCSIDSATNNLDGDASCPAGITEASITKILNSLNDNGCLTPGPAGCVRTHALAPLSPALDAGDESICPATDQRGEPRNPPGDPCDIGAFEGFVDGSACFTAGTSSGNVVVFCL